MIAPELTEIEAFKEELQALPNKTIHLKEQLSQKKKKIGKIGGKMSAILDYGPQFIEK